MAPDPRRLLHVTFLISVTFFTCVKVTLTFGGFRFSVKKGAGLEDF